MAENFSVIKGSINACNSGLAKLGSHGVMGLDSGLWCFGRFKPWC